MTRYRRQPRRLSAYTDQRRNPGANNIELETVQPLALPGSGSRFLVFSADVADVTCGPLRPSPATTLFAFFLLTAGKEIPLASAPSDVCSAGHDLGNNVIGGRISSDGSILFSGSTLGLRLRNGQASGNGNDHAFEDGWSFTDKLPAALQVATPNGHPRTARAAS